MEMEVRKALEHQAVAEVLHLRAGKFLRQGFVYALDYPVFRNEIPVIRDVHPSQGGGGDNGALDDGQRHAASSFLRGVPHKRKGVSVRKQSNAHRPDTHSRAFRRLRRDVRTLPSEPI